MDTQVEFRNSERFRHESLIMLEDRSFGYPSFAVMCNVSKTGMYFESVFELQPGTNINIKIDEPSPKTSQNFCCAQVIWCEELEDNSNFRYGIGVKYC